MIEIFKMEKPDIYKNSIEKESEEVNSLKGIEDSHKRSLKLYYLYANKDPFHAVMNFLEGDLGCRFYTDKISYFPVKNELKIAIANIF